MSQPRPRRMLLCILSIAPLAGCTSGGFTDSLYIAHDTVVGVNAAVDNQRVSGRLVVGYDRNFGTYVPKSVPDVGDARDAMSILSCSELTVSGINLTGFTEKLATGAAADTYARRIADGNSTMFNCIDTGNGG